MDETNKNKIDFDDVEMTWQEYLKENLELLRDLEKKKGLTKRDLFINVVDTFLETVKPDLEKDLFEWAEKVCWDNLDKMGKSLWVNLKKGLLLLALEQDGCPREQAIKYFGAKIKGKNTDKKTSDIGSGAGNSTLDVAYKIAKSRTLRVQVVDYELIFSAIEWAEERKKYAGIGTLEKSLKYQQAVGAYLRIMGQIYFYFLNGYTVQKNNMDCSEYRIASELGIKRCQHIVEFLQKTLIEYGQKDWVDEVDSLVAKKPQ